MKIHTIIGYWQGLIEEVKTFKDEKDAVEFKKFLEDDWGLTEAKEGIRNEMIANGEYNPDDDECEYGIDRVVAENGDKEVLHYITELQ